MAKTDYDWQAIGAEYITGKLSLRALAAKLGCSLSTIGRQASNRDWDSKREQWRNDNAEAVQELKKERNVLDRLRFDELTEGSCDALLALIRLEAGRLLSIAQAAARQGSGSLGCLSIDAQDMKFLAEAMKRIQDIKYRALDIPPVTVVKNMVGEASSPGAQSRAELLMLLQELGPEALSQLAQAALTQAEA